MKIFHLKEHFKQFKTASKITPQTSGKDFRDKFVSVSPNVVLVVCGHIGKPGDFEDAVAYLWTRMWPAAMCIG